MSASELLVEEPAFVPTLNIHTRSDVAAVVWMNSNKIEVKPWSQSCEILVRPDCKEESIIVPIEQVLFSLGGSISRRYPVETTSAHSATPGSVIYSPIILVTNTNETSIWSEITLILGVNPQMQRTVFLNVASAKAVNASLFSRNQASEDLETFARQLINQIFGILDSAHVLGGCTTDLSPIPEQMPEGIMDVGFIRDLQAAVAQNMNDRLNSEVMKIDEAMKAYELKCARLMTLLKATYVRANLSLPQVPEKVSLMSYPLKLKRPLSIRDINLEQGRLLLLRARRNYREFLQNRKASNLGGRRDMIQLGTNHFRSEDYDKYACQVSFLVNDLTQQCMQWSDEEYSARIQRKIAAVKDRYEALRRFKIQLLVSLHDRFATAKSDQHLLSGWGFGGLSADKKFQLAIQEKFPFVDDSEPVVVDASGIVDGKKSGIYLTSGHILCHSAGVLMGVSAPTLVVIPYKTINNVQIYLANKLLSSVDYEQVESITTGPKETGSGRINASEPTSRTGESGTPLPTAGVYYLWITDFAGVMHELRFQETTADYAVRIFDVIDFIIKEKLFMVAEYQPHQRVAFMKTEQADPTALTSLEDLGDMLEITFGPASSGSATTTDSLPSSAVVDSGTEKPTQALDDPDLQILQDFFEATPTITTTNKRDDPNHATAAASISASKADESFNLLDLEFDDPSFLAADVQKSQVSPPIVPHHTPPPTAPSSDVGQTQLTSASSDSAMETVPAPSGGTKGKMASNIQKFLQQSRK